MVDERFLLDPNLVNAIKSLFSINAERIDSSKF